MRYVLIFLFTAVLFLSTFGCGKKGMSPESIGLLNMAASISEERAASFALIAPQITTKNEAEAETIELYSELHLKGLSEQAKALTSLRQAAEINNGKIKTSLLRQVKNSVETAKARAENFLVVKDMVKAKDEANEARVKAWLDAHAEALIRQVAVLKNYSGSLDGEEDKK